MELQPTTATSARQTPDGLRQRMQDVGAWHDGQMAGRRWAIGCVSLEITQRCNLDCELCYLSEHSEAVRDIPLEEVFRRIERIHAEFGPDTDIQVSGGEPTLRRRDELVDIVKRITARGMRASLFTNGILASRELLCALAGAGLSDVAFHVDLTQRRKGFDTERSLNDLRLRYIERARGLPLAVFFNTTVFERNLAEIASVVRFFADHADVVRVASFQLQADTGRGVLRGRADGVSQESVMAAIEAGAGTKLDFDALGTGHPCCNRYAVAWVVAGRLHDAFADRAFVRRFMRQTQDVVVPRRSRAAAARAFIAAVASRPGLWLGGLGWLARTLWRLRLDLARGRGRVHKLSFFVHNFMDARALDPERVHACVFMAATQDGPVSMCAYNARRDEYLLRPLTLADGSLWSPLRATPSRRGPPAAVYPIRFLKGRARHDALRERGATRRESPA
jgi:tetraether lipid synthase